MAKKSQSLVTYDNDLNMIALRGMTQIENDVFFALLYKLKNKSTNEVKLDFSELKTLIGFEDQNNEHIRKSIFNIAEKIAKSVVKYVGEKETQFFTLFQVLAIPNDDDYYIRAKISEPFAYMLNELEKSFTAFDIAEFSSLSSKYTQTIYRLLKQFRFTGLLRIDWEKFKELLDIPKSYQNSDIERRILKPSIKELGSNISLFYEKCPIFKNLAYEKEYFAKRGRPIKSIIFRFEPEPRKMDILNGKVKKDHSESLAQKTRKTIIEQKKAQEPKFNALTNKAINWYDEYISSRIKAKNELLGGYDSCKIMNIFQVGSKYRASIKNQENEKIFYKDFNDETHFKNWFKNVQIHWPFFPPKSVWFAMEQSDNIANRGFSHTAGGEFAPAERTNG